jgi:DNA-binding NarL/FixJ family response regulator
LPVPTALACRRADAALTDQVPCLIDDCLTPRERQVARFVALGMRNAEIAAALGITTGTAKLHVYRIFKKVEVHSRRELCGYALRVGLV